ncbi:hypothetical protein [Mesorhizobium sp.]|uniref:hypothetical protein n=1 Tax=Mesorhizobium sp. TaxID=1871066 RepID=UPI00345D4852
MIKLFRAGGTVSSLMDRKRGRRQGHRALDKDREAVVRRTIEGFYLKPTRPSFARLVREVQIDCSTAGPLELVQIDHTKVDVATQTSSRFSRTARRQHS